MSAFDGYDDGTLVHLAARCLDRIEKATDDLGTYLDELQRRHKLPKHLEKAARGGL